MDAAFLRLLPLMLPLAGCVSAPTPPPAPPKAPAPRVVAAPAAPPSASWADRPASPGTWVYRHDERGGLALFGVPGQDASFVLRCDQRRGRVEASVPMLSSVGSVMTLTATSAVQRYALVPTGGTPAYAAAILMPGDPMLDAMAFSRGRFMVTTGDNAGMIIPARPEVIRIIEDCRAR